MEQIWVILDGWAPWVLPTSSLADTCCHHMGRNVGHFHSKIGDFLHHYVPFDFCCGDSKVIQSTNESFVHASSFEGFGQHMLLSSESYCLFLHHASYHHISLKPCYSSCCQSFWSPPSLPFFESCFQYLRLVPFSKPKGRPSC